MSIQVNVTPITAPCPYCCSQVEVRGSDPATVVETPRCTACGRQLAVFWTENTVVVAVVSAREVRAAT